eukprot:CAMPEP_0194398164 /NCGR_PEP_ID=MMETSP0174-20130528/125953_1 /TAXON_ID=216777 /ORGANISM="Proboscia alata, Strain PI-D3" /LENGTH=231 /DNA_ID=CAMNT_0039194433 /DNA_START=149 /DNA_END=844 /DNA_ORIENTATION=-
MAMLLITIRRFGVPTAAQTGAFIFGQHGRIKNYPQAWQQHAEMFDCHTPKQLYSSRSSTSSQTPRPNNNTYWVTNAFLAGEYPGDTSGDPISTQQKLRHYLDCGVTYFLDLTREGEKDEYYPLLQDLDNSISYRRMAVRDYDTPKPQQMKLILDVMDDAIRDGRVVYVHCRAGIGRTGTVVGSYLVRHGRSGDEALKELNRLYSNSQRSVTDSSTSPETQDQVSFVLDWNE